MFFREGDVIRRGTAQYDDFWKFHAKIEAIKEKGMGARLKEDRTGRMKKIVFGDKEVEVPEVYSKKHTLRFSLQYKKIEDYIYRLNPG